MGVVCKARHRELGCTRAVKVLELQDQKRVARFEREAQALARVRHRNVVAVHDAGRAGPLLYFAMDLVEGTTLEALIAKRELSAARALEATAGSRAPARTGWG